MKSHATTTHDMPVTSMLDSIESLKSADRSRKSFSNSKMLLMQFKQLRASYAKLDAATQASFNDFMQKNHPEFLLHLQKSGSQIINIAELGGMIDDEILGNLKSFLRATSAYQSESEGTYAQLLRKLSHENISECSTGTFRISTSDNMAHPNQLQDAINSPGLKKMSTTYLNHLSIGLPDVILKQDSLTIMIELFEKLQKNKEIKSREIERNQLTPDYLDANHRVIRETVQVLISELQLNTLRRLITLMPEYPQLQEILSRLSLLQNKALKDQFVIQGEAISNLLDNELIAGLQKVKMSDQKRGFVLSP